MPCKYEFCQPLTPMANNLFLSFLVGFIPILVVLVSRSKILELK